MLKRFLIICVCVCCIISVMGLSSNRFNYEGVQTAANSIIGSSDVVRDDINTIAILSYYWGDRVGVTYDYENITLMYDNNKTLIYRYYYRSDNSIINEQIVEYSTPERAQDAFNMIGDIILSSGVIDYESADNILEKIALGIASIVDLIKTIIAILFTFIYMIFDIFSVGIVVVRSVLWVVGFI